MNPSLGFKPDDKDSKTCSPQSLLPIVSDKTTTSIHWVWEELINERQTGITCSLFNIAVVQAGNLLTA